MPGYIGSRAQVAFSSCSLAVSSFADQQPVERTATRRQVRIRPNLPPPLISRQRLSVPRHLVVERRTKASADSHSDVNPIGSSRCRILDHPAPANYKCIKTEGKS